MASSIGFRILSCLPSCYSSYGAWTLTPVGLAPTDHASLRWTHTSRYQSAVDECIGDWALADELREIAGRKPVCNGTDRSLLRSVLGPWSPVPKCEAPGAPISVEEHTSMVPRPRRQSQNSPLRNSSAIRHDPGRQIPRLKYSPGLAPTTRLNALLKAAPDS